MPGPYASTLSIEERDGVVTLTLSDDGLGSACLDAGPGHLGMATMRARADAEDGEVQVESIAGSGTVVTLTLPIMTAELVAVDPRELEVAC